MEYIEPKCRRLTRLTNTMLFCIWEESFHLHKHHSHSQRYTPNKFISYFSYELQKEKREDTTATEHWNGDGKGNETKTKKEWNIIVCVFSYFIQVPKIRFPLRMFVQKTNNQANEHWNICTTNLKSTISNILSQDARWDDGIWRCRSVHRHTGTHQRHTYGSLFYLVCQFISIDWKPIYKYILFSHKTKWHGTLYKQTDE